MICTECSIVLMFYKYNLVRGWWVRRNTCRDPLEQIRFWHFYLEKVRTIEQINVFNDLRKNNTKNNRGTSVQTNNDAGVMFENFLGGQRLPRWSDRSLHATCWRVVIMSDLAGETFFIAAVFFSGTLWHSVNGHFARDSYFERKHHATEARCLCRHLCTIREPNE